MVDDLDPVIAAYSKDYGIARKISALEEKRQALQVDVDDAQYAKKTAEEAGKSEKSGQLEKAQEKLKQCDDQIAALRQQLDAGRQEIEALRQPYASDPEFQKYEAYRDDGIDLARLEYNEMRRLRRDMQLIFQDPYSSLNPRMSVGQIISEGMQAHNMIKKKDARMQQLVLNIMDECGLAPYFLHRFPHQFSGGQRQRIGIARALATNPKFVVCDEAVSALDVSIQAQIINLLLDLKEQQNLTYMFITHDLSVVKYISDRVGVMYLGTMVELAAADEIFHHPIHPYTEALLNAIPTTDTVGAKRSSPSSKAIFPARSTRRRAANSTRAASTAQRSARRSSRRGKRSGRTISSPAIISSKSRSNANDLSEESRPRHALSEGTQRTGGYQKTDGKRIRTS